MDCGSAANPTGSLTLHVVECLSRKPPTTGRGFSHSPDSSLSDSTDSLKLAAANAHLLGAVYNLYALARSFGSFSLSVLAN
jgi:hypothetical protein